MLASLASFQQRFHVPERADFGFEPGDPRRLEPLSLEQQDKRAEDLLRELRAGDRDALVRWQCQGGGGGARSLSAARGIIAREHGFGGWPEFVVHLERIESARGALAGGAPTALDADVPTLHVRCGWDIAQALVGAGFAGDFLVFADPYVQGPVPATETLGEFLQVRAEYLADGDPDELTKCLARLRQDYAELERIRDYPRVMLWFEHDSYDQLILLKLLHYLGDPERRPLNLHLIGVTGFPGVERFNGIGQLPPEAMRVLWEDFRGVTEDQFALGRRAWEALTAATPVALAELAGTGTPELPTAARALRRHLGELPAKGNGLSLTEELTLAILSEKGPMNAARLFGWYTNHYESLPFLGDTQYWRVLAGLARGGEPALRMDKRGKRPAQWDLALTSLGDSLLAGKADWMALEPEPRWVGGVRIDAGKGEVWCIDRGTGGVVRRRTPRR